MGISCEFLRLCDVTAMPVEQPFQRGCDAGSEDGWVEDILPGCGRGKDSTPSEDEEKECGSIVEKRRL